ncbi:hypothetical protein A3F27_00390 [Candidatus Kaiserbacteria bacterium RIFCSPHIGHO2_12_FULL_53_13]|uniref:Glutamate--tRNA ligase n=1 Tax=Candidatus Kaiserbacteria bacterium RIFCSPHIGHO2_12_FULL_53_13 TaxID=1798502 RepID=A0A1F6E782_9BACT|nr:MAG: hypothetical protein A3F27_00390 [Candidatus Kaiserbacteria bacterium RIFCSPHIGHO2_12_FULL_53_13]OGG74419.1 MAG: hypothetical protein A3A37_02095 [Candidatus Kaiserbacteria bacterium RIFCSPLOWO2_01_FULL_52_36]
MKSGLVRVRIPPSPTGFCHVGTARMAILNFLFARRHGGQIIFRSEDTDKERSNAAYEEDIIESLKWLGLEWEEFYRQSERTLIYKKYLEQLINADKAYISVEESKKEPGKMASVVRLRNPGTLITFHDLIRGDITFDTAELKDFAIARSVVDPLYHFAVVADDAEMSITHVIRGEEHISNTPRQILIQEALGLARPQYAHYPLHLAADKSKLSKRKGDVSVRDYREKGYLPQALLNYIALLGWTPPSGREVMDLNDMIKEFNIEDLHRSGAVFDIEKLRWFNRQYLTKMPEKIFANETMRIMAETLDVRGVAWSENVGRSLVTLVRERISVWEDLRALVSEGEFDYFFTDPKLDRAEIPEKGKDPANAARHLDTINKILADSPNELFADQNKIKEAVWSYATKEGRGAVLWPFRYALTGRARSPDPFEVAAIIGKEPTLRRINSAISILGNA